MTEPRARCAGFRYGSWPRRAAAVGIDGLPIVGLVVLAFGLVWLTRIRACDADPSVRDLGPLCGSGISSLGQGCFVASWLAIVGYCAWNLGLRQGTTGSSIGKSVCGLRVVDAVSGRPIGFRRSVIRQLVHASDVMTLGIGYLWPLWDRKHQTFADKLVSTVVSAKGIDDRHRHAEFPHRLP